MDALIALVVLGVSVGVQHGFGWAIIAVSGAYALMPYRYGRH